MQWNWKFKQRRWQSAFNRSRKGEASHKSSQCGSPNIRKLPCLMKIHDEKSKVHKTQLTFMPDDNFWFVYGRLLPYSFLAFSLAIQVWLYEVICVRCVCVGVLCHWVFFISHLAFYKQLSSFLMSTILHLTMWEVTAGFGLINARLRILKSLSQDGSPLWMWLIFASYSVLWKMILGYRIGKRSIKF